MAETIVVDRPIESPEEDTLGRSHFAKIVASTISRWKGDESLTIALSGPWGTGKSSLKNMILRTLETTGKEAPYVVEFNPWKWPDQNEAAKAFFREVWIALRRIDKTISGSQRAQRWQRYGKLLTLSSEAIDSAIDAIPILMSIAAFLGLTASVISNPTVAIWFALIAAALAAVTSVLRLSGRFASKVSEWIGTLVDEVPLEELKKELKQDLAKLNRPVLVIVDDIDRLNKNETNQLFQHVKANADFPNLMYLLLFQKDIVEKHLTTKSVNGRAYLEKIVDLHFDLPSIDPGRLNRMLFDGLDGLLNNLRGAIAFDRTRWGNIYLGSLHYYFQNIRHIKRFLSTLAVHMELFKSAEAFEVNQIDLIAIETLRVFEPDLHRALSRSQSLLISAQGRDAAAVAAHGQSVKDLLSFVAPERKSAVEELLKELFPSVARVFGGSAYGPDWHARWTTDRRICSSVFFDRYFEFGLREKTTSESDFVALLGATAHREDFVATIREFQGRGLLDAVLARLDDYKEKIPVENTEQFLLALFDIGDDLVDDVGAFVGPHMYVVRAALWHMRRIQPLDRRGEIVIEALKGSQGLSVPARLISGDISRREKADDRSWLLFTEDQLVSAKAVWVVKVSARAAQEPLQFANSPHLLGNLYTWREFADESAPRGWVKELLELPGGALAFLRAITVRSVVHTVGDRVSRDKWTTRLKYLEDFTSIEVIEHKTKEESKGSLTEADVRALQAFEKALERRKAGKSDDSFSDYD
ncbi:MAG: hypothetical protein EPO55_02210 [Reyranella sp.]|uniref:KAP family P-loop NTPase fold protein n=1 Tax=Reyranella sp. TaxID=1929291 RepID=UPI00120ABBBB|nr:P-loop NTPase fold protein [Reyranella sp.]TAJ42470.1 MAG: hypothetical protein EPO55_02210 [Reyranella sp.]